MTPDQISSLPLDVLDRALAGETTEGDRVVLARFGQQYPDSVLLLEQLRSRYMRSAGTSEQLDRMYHEAMHRVAASSTSPTEHAERFRRRMSVDARSVRGIKPFRRFFWPTMAATAACGVAIAFGWAAGTHNALQRTTRSALTYTTGNGQRGTVTLPDGSIVTLNVGSRLEVPADYASGNHVVGLDGNAMFTIPHRSDVPLTVIAGGVATRVLGTSFAVRHYSTDVATTVAVREGKVSVDAREHQMSRVVVVSAAQQIVVNASTHGVAHLESADSSQFSFTTGVLTLNAVPFHDAVVELNRWYDADIRVSDATVLANRRMTARLSAGSVAELAEILEGTFNVRVVRDGRVLTLYRR